MFGLFLSVFLIVVGAIIFESGLKVKIPTEEKEKEYAQKEKMSSYKMGAGLILVGIVVFAISFAFNGNSNDSSSSTSTSGTYCESCHNRFDDRRNERYLKYTDMCRTCYRNYCYATGRTPEDYDRDYDYVD